MARKALCLVPFVVALLAASFRASAPSFAGGVTKLQKEPRTALQYKKRSIALKKPFYSPDAKRFADIEQEWRHERRSGQATDVVTKPDMSKLPSTEDIFSRKFSGESSQDPVGGRKWYSLYMVYGADTLATKSLVETHVKKLNLLLQGKLSAKNIEVAVITQPKGTKETLPSDVDLDPKAPDLPGSWLLEMPMKVYGDVEKKGTLESRTAPSSPRTAHQNGYLLRWDFQLPPSAIEPLSRLLYREKTLLRFMFLKHTRQFHHVGEDNELLL
mmetsp:Transcript_59877/g.110885  ORF Transcript_59877/g.110885 Transcript_59877/m.110885 type:complete len:271 (-) Transcript_59877:56-868(-)